MSAGNRVIGVGMEYVNVLDEGQDLVEAAKNLARPRRLSTAAASIRTGTPERIHATTRSRTSSPLSRPPFIVRQ